MSGCLLAGALAALGGGAGVAGVASAQAPRSGVAGRAPEQSVRIDIRGAIAHVTVTRWMTCAAPGGSGAPWTASSDPEEGAARADRVLDVALPARAALLNVSMASGEGRRFQPLRTSQAGPARALYQGSLPALGARASEVAFDDEARVRVRVACDSDKPRNIIGLKYEFSILLEILSGRARLAFPAAAELSPPSSRVDVRVTASDPLAEISIAGASHPVAGQSMPAASDTVSMRSPWVVTVTPASLTNGSGAGGVRAAAPRLSVLSSVGGGPSGPTALAYAIGAGGAAPQPLPGRVLFLVDRSRSVGPGGLEAERDAARKILEALPPATRFDVVFFDRAQRRLFPAARVATRETIAALEDEMTPAHLANGTDLPEALRATGDVLRRDAADFWPRCLLVILTDGAVGVPGPGVSLPDLIGALPGQGLMVAALSVRPNDDPPVSQEERRALRSLAAAASLGGAERSFRTGDLTDAVPGLIESLAAGGDLFGVSLGVGERAVVAEVIEPPAGVSGVVALARPAVTQLPTLSFRSLRRPVPLRPIAVEPSWLSPLLERPAASAWSLVLPGAAALVEPVVRPSPAAPAEASPRGFMERSVVRDALSLAFTPRARACYLNRTARTAADRDLSGRVRLALELVRGEVAATRVEESTLSNPGIEACLREAAFAIEVPRAYRNDDAVTAILNLVFRPRTPEHRPAVDENLGREIDLMIDAALKDQDAADAGVPREGGGTAPSPAPGTGRADPTGSSTTDSPPRRGPDPSLDAARP